jgi:hypothetical protein
MVNFGISDTEPSGSTTSISHPFPLLVGTFNNNSNCAVSCLALSIPGKRMISPIYKQQHLYNCATEELFLPQLLSAEFLADSVSLLPPDSPPHS